MAVDLREEATAEVLAVAARISQVADALIQDAGLDRKLDLLAALGAAHGMALAFVVDSTGADMEEATQVQEKLLRVMSSTFRGKKRFNA